MKIWKAHFSDEKHDTHIDIINTEGTFSDDSLSFTINGTDFFGSGFDDFHLTSPEKYDFDTNEFQLLKWGTKNKGYEYSLQRFSMEITIPFPVINIKTNKTENSFLRIKYACEQSKENERSVQCILDDEVVFGDVYKMYDFSLHINKEIYKSNNSLFFYFEDNLIDIYRKIKNKYMMKCCFTCQWSDYSPYGNSDFGTMMCYRKHKEEYSKVNDKETYFKYADNLDFESKQETYICREYEPRIHFSGYRGFIE